MDYITRAKKFRAKKKLGQNFLIDNSAIDFIIENANINENDVVLEIGAGLGFVTEKLAQKAKKVYAVEIDKDAICELEKLPYENIEIIEQDILKIDISQYAKNSKIKIIANIPYYITSPILAHLLGEIDDENNLNRNSISLILLMVQYEVAKRICASNNSKNKDYGALSILCNFYSDTMYLEKISSKSFFPSPKVDSAIIKILPSLSEKYLVKNKKLLRKIVSTAFKFRRKTLKNALMLGGFSKNDIEQVYQKLSISPNIRGENLSINKFVEISDELNNLL